MLAQSVQGPFNGNEWFFEIKWDGVRAIVYINDDLSIRSRNDRELAGQFPELAELSSLAPGTVLDGEIVAMNMGKPDIQALLPRLQTGTAKPYPTRGDVPVTYIVFDILEKDKKPLIDLPLSERRKILRQAVTESPHVILSDPVESRGEEYYAAAVAKGLEGIMAKKKNSVYEPGKRSASWLKIKAQKTCDCVIAGYTRGQGSRRLSFGALLLGLYETGSDDDLRTETRFPPGKKSPLSFQNTPDSGKNKESRLVYIGKVGTGLSEKDLGDLLTTFSALETSTPQLSGTGKNEQITWLRPFLVCEVAYQEVTRDRKLRIPRFIRIRADKKPQECSTGQLDEVEVDPKQTGPKGRCGPGRESGTGSTPGEEEMKKGNQKQEQKKPSLDDYHAKRDFSKTREPLGLTDLKAGGNYFVIHEHHARHLHFDLRLERDGVLKSWAVPKGIPEVAGEKHFAVAVEDHPLDYGHFEGTIPEGEYGAGTVSIWDNGTYETKHWDPKKIEITLHGRRLNGTYVLVTFSRAGKNEWLVFRAGG